MSLLALWIRPSPPYLIYNFVIVQRSIWIWHFVFFSEPPSLWINDPKYIKLSTTFYSIMRITRQEWSWKDIFYNMTNRWIECILQWWIIDSHHTRKIPMTSLREDIVKWIEISWIPVAYDKKLKMFGEDIEHNSGLIYARQSNRKLFNIHE